LGVGFRGGREGKERLGKWEAFVWEFTKLGGKVLGGFGGVILYNFKVPPNWGVLGG
jgi:hypothetical protein